MPNIFKNTWWIFLLIVSGVVILFLSLHMGKTQNDQGVVLNDIFLKKPPPESPVTPVVPVEPIPSVAPVPPAAVAVSPKNNLETGFTIQVYSFQDRKKAENALQALKNNGYQAFLSERDLGGKGVWYRVRVRGAGDVSESHKMLDEIRKKYNSGFILKVKKQI
jgi:cell division septation protein DedD